MFAEILESYGISAAATVQPFGAGLINHTWQVIDGQHPYILQKINDQVFKHPEYIASNIEKIAAHLREKHPGYLFITPLKTLDGKPLLHVQNQGYFRLYPFVENSYTHNVAQTPELAYEAGLQFGLFTKMLSDFPVQTLATTLPDFHNLTLRYQQFSHACSNGNPSRIAEAKAEIKFLTGLGSIVDTYRKIIADPNFELRVMHHDTKISNVLFTKDGKGICVIDLDTVMPGYFISDVGDMIRTYISPASEEEKDFTRLQVREAYFTSILSGYLHHMADQLTASEVEYFVYAGKFMIYMQALRFLTDHLNNDLYYGAVYPGQNYVRARNQIVLLQQLLQHEERLNEIVSAALLK